MTRLPGQPRRGGLMVVHCLHCSHTEQIYSLELHDYLQRHAAENCIGCEEPDLSAEDPVDDEVEEQG